LHTQASTINILLVGWRNALRTIIQMMSVVYPAFLLGLMSNPVLLLKNDKNASAESNIGHTETVV
jgi:hypothetical protein